MSKQNNRKSRKSEVVSRAGGAQTFASSGSVCDGYPGTSTAVLQIRGPSTATATVSKQAVASKRQRPATPIHQAIPVNGIYPPGQPGLSHVIYTLLPARVVDGAREQGGRPADGEGLFQ